MASLPSDMAMGIYRPLFDVSAGNDYAATGTGVPTEVELFNRGGGKLAAPLPMGQLSSLLSTDLVETENEFRMMVDLPGVDPKDLQLTLDNDVLEMKAERKFSNETTTNKVHCAERSYGMIQRRVKLPANADTGGVQTSFLNGVLTVTFPKRQQQQQLQQGEHPMLGPNPIMMQQMPTSAQESPKAYSNRNSYIPTVEQDEEGDEQQILQQQQSSSSDPALVSDRQPASNNKNNNKKRKMKGKEEEKDVEEGGDMNIGRGGTSGSA